MQSRIGKLIIFMAVLLASIYTGAQAPTTQNRVFEWTFSSQKAYADPFNDVDVDVIFTKGKDTWRVPTFWRGGNKWTVRFAPPSPGRYSYHLESTDKNNADLNGHDGHVTITAYTGANAFLKHGDLRIGPDKRHFEQADGTPFYWLGDTWWTGMSDRLNWHDFQQLTNDRKAKGFTVVQIVAGLVPFEEKAPSDPGFCNEGGCVWDAQFKQINPKFFDYADRRIQYLVDAGIAPAIVGAWNDILSQIGVERMKKHWRYVIARYGAYPVFWVVGGEVFDPPSDIRKRLSSSLSSQGVPGGWTEVARYIHATDPYHHLVTVHELPPPYDFPLQDESLMDFDMFQPSHLGWPSIAMEVIQLDLHRARTTVAKPEVVGEIGYERIGETHLQDFQRTAFWLAMLNGAAGHTYGAVGVWEAYTNDKPLHRWKWSFLTSQEAMNLPGSYQVGIGSKLLRQYEWWKLEPHPEWVTPSGTTLLEPRSDISNFDWGSGGLDAFFGDNYAQPLDAVYPAGEWKARGGNFRLPYAAGIPGKLRIIYAPCFGLNCATPPTVLGLEPGVRYHAYYWEPSMGIKVDLGAVLRPAPAAILREDKFDGNGGSDWSASEGKALVAAGKYSISGDTVATLNGTSEANLVASVEAHGDGTAGLVLRFHDSDNYLAALYSPEEKAIYLLDRQKGADGVPLRRTTVPELGSTFRLSAEVRGTWATLSLSDGAHTYTTGIVHIGNHKAGSAGLLHRGDGAQSFADFVLRSSPALVTDDHLDRTLHDANGVFRGEMEGGGLSADPSLETLTSGWGVYGREKMLLLDQYRPPRLPTAGDWVLVLESKQ